MTTQNEKVLEILRRGSVLTARTARSQYRILNVSARVAELRKQGVRIDSVPYVRKDGIEGVKYVLSR